MFRTIKIIGFVFVLIALAAACTPMATNGGAYSQGYGYSGRAYSPVLPQPSP